MSKIQETADRIVELEEEVEASGHATMDAAALAEKLAILHQWVDGIKGVVVSPGLGRVTVIHENGRASTISSADLPFILSKPIS